jgi:hypothetical protein
VSGCRGADHAAVAPRVVQHLPRSSQLAQRLARHIGADAEDLGAKVVERRLAGGERVGLDRERADENAVRAHDRAS